MKSDVLKSLALKAKNRMIHNSTIGRVCGYGDNTTLCDVKIIEESDEAFFNKVRSLMLSSENVENPIKMLMSEDMMLGLDNRGKEKYLLETIEKYLKYRKMIQEEIS